MRSPVRHQQDELDLERSCREVEAAVSRVAKVVLLASALAEQVDARSAVDPAVAAQRPGRVRLLRDAAEAGRRTISELAAPARPPAQRRRPA